MIREKFRYRILAIDDTPANLLTLGAALGEEFELQIAISGPQGLALAGRDAPDLILLDIMMPEMDGHEVCRRLKADPALRAIPVVFVTALGEPAAEAAGLALGAVDYLSKPINVEVARQRIRNLLEREALRKAVEVQRDHLGRQVEQLRKLQTAVNQSPASVVITDADALIEYVNPRFTEITGYQPEEAIGQNPRILQSGETAPAVYRAMWETLTAGEVWRGKLRNRRRNGELYWEEAQIAPVRDEHGTITHYVAVKTDVTARQAIEEARDEALARLHKIASRVPGVVYQYRLRPDGTSCFPFASEAIRDIYRVDPAMVQEDASAVFDVLHPDDVEGVAASIRQSAVTLLPWQQEYRVRFPDGTVRWLRGDAVPEREADGSVLWHGFISDITQRKKTEEELRLHRLHLEALVAARTQDLSVAKEAAEAANRAKTTFLSTMSHELRTPLNGIMGMSTLAQRKATDPQQIQYLQKLDLSARHLLSIISDLLDVARIESERLSLAQGEFSPVDVVGEVLGMIEPEAEGKGLSLRSELTPEVRAMRLLGDAPRLAQVLAALVNNAVKFTPAGEVVVSARVFQKTAEGTILRFQVRDTGIGIEHADLGRIFSAFEQADGSSQRRCGGAGLGLALGKRLVEMMGGEIGVASTPGQGSTFWFTAAFEDLPPVNAPSPVSGNLSDEAWVAMHHAGRRVLVVEDEPINQEVVRLLLESAGLRVDVAADGAVAVRLAGQQAYDLILMDMQMPVMGGLEATQAIRATARGAHLPIVALTANAFSEDRDACLAAGMNDFIAKPLEPAQLFATLVRCWSSGEN